MYHCSCTLCSKTLELEIDATGRKVQCYHCQGKFVVESCSKASPTEEPTDPAPKEDAPKPAPAPKAEPKQEAPKKPTGPPKSRPPYQRRSAPSNAATSTAITPAVAEAPPARSKLPMLIGAVILVAVLVGVGIGVAQMKKTSASANSITEPKEEVAAAPVRTAVDATALIVPAADLKVAGKIALEAPSNRLLLKSGTGKITWQSRVAEAGRYQVWVTVYSDTPDATAALSLNGSQKSKNIMDMSAPTITAFYNDEDEKIRWKDKTKAPVDTPYYFREYWGTFEFTGDVDLELELATKGLLAVESIELMREQKSNELAPLLETAIDFYDGMREPGALVADAYDTRKKRRGGISSTASAGVALSAYAMSYQLGRDPKAREKALDLLRIHNGKNPGVKPARHKSGHFMHFTNIKTGSGKSEYSTIDTAILISGALMARNTFGDAKITAEADELWNSVDWSAAVISPDPGMPKFYLTGAQMDGEAKGSISMFNEYLMLAWYCQLSENEKMGNKARPNIMPDLNKMPRIVYRNRLVLSNKIGWRHTSFLVQFPFYMTHLCADETYFSWTAAQAVADRETCIEKYQDRSAWGVGPGATPEKGYDVISYDRNPENVVAPRIVAGFFPVHPPAVEDFLLRYQPKDNRLRLPFGYISPRFSPDTPDWKPQRIAGVDFSCLLFGMAAKHPKLGMAFLKDKTRFTFNK